MAKKRDAAKSAAQAELAAKLEEWFPFARIRQEVYVGELIEAHGFSVDEIARELGNRPHRLFCDIMLSDSDGDCVFEYNGEQHYHQIGGMTGTLAELGLNQHLDREKSWILERIGIPLVQLPYDAYIDASVAARMMEDASAALEEAQAKMYVCDGCGRRFPAGELTSGLCRRCVADEQRRAEEEYEREVAAGRAIREEDIEPDWEEPDAPDAEDEEWDAGATNEWEETRKAEQKAWAKERRREAYQQWKESPEYQRRKEEQRAARKSAYQEMKRRRKEARDGR